MEEMLRENIALLIRTPAVLDALLRGLPGIWTRSNEGGTTWNVREIVGHMAHCEREDWIPRAKIILEHGEGEAFPPLNRLGHVEEIEGKTLDELLEEFAGLRGRSLKELEGLALDENELAKRGTHPAFGAVTLAQLLSTWATHDLTHLHQISRVMAYQRHKAVGPWKAYLGVLKGVADS